MSLLAENLVGLNSLSKTLRFELIPEGRTNELMGVIFSKTDLSEDKIRSLEYANAKGIIDDYYRYYIDTVLSKEIFDTNKIAYAYNLYQDGDKIKIAEEQKKLRKNIVKVFEDSKVSFSLKEYSKLLSIPNNCSNLERKNKKDGMNLYTWLTKQLEDGKIDQDEYEKKTKTLNYFAKFTTYFKAFQKNRENMFSEEEQSTAIAYRIVNENMMIFFSNLKIFSLIEKDHKELYEKISIYAEEMSVRAFANMLNQKGIDKYNDVIGNVSNGDKPCINTLINEYRQKNNIKSRQIPLMTKLYKQILSCGTTENRYINIITNDTEMYETAQKVVLETKDSLKLLKRCLEDFLTKDNLERIFIRTNRLTSISQSIYSDWSFINHAFNQENIPEIVNLKELNERVEQYIKTLDMDVQEMLLEKGEPSKYFLMEHTIVDLPSMQEFEDGSREEELKKIKNSLDSVLAAINSYKCFYLFENGKPIVADNDEDFYNTFLSLFSELLYTSKVYDKIRDYATKKTSSVEKFKANFSAPTLLDGWDKNKESANLGVLLKKGDKFYLAIMHYKFKKIFNFNDEDVARKALSGTDFYQKMEYKQVTGASKMLPKVFLAPTNAKTYKPSTEIKNIRDRKLYRKEANNIEAVCKWIEFNQECIKKHPEWNDYFDFEFKKPCEYKDTAEFYSDFDRQAYSISFKDISAKYIDEMVEDRKLFLFRIHNKDFAEHANGKPNMHTLYWRALFDRDNLDNITKDSSIPVFKLNGEAEIFCRPASLPVPSKPTHPKQESIANKNKLNPKSHSTFDFDIYKDRRFMHDKLFFHCPITINFRAPKTTTTEINRRVNEFVSNDKTVNIIGIDRGERHLLYYTLINQKGEIIERGSLNQITNTYESNGKNMIATTDYHQLLSAKADNRAEARQNWGTIESIKDLKAGYLSQAISKITRLAVDKNAVIVMENLNLGFKRSRIKVEKQVYQKFEKALIEKLNYLVFKDVSGGDAGHVLKGYQLVAPFESFRNLSVQSGIIYYVVPSYTSHICPKTGFVNILNLKYTNIKDAQNFFNTFDKISYNSECDYFEFHLDYSKFNKRQAINKWVICTWGTERYYYKKNEGYKLIDVTRAIKNLFDKYGIQYGADGDLREHIFKKEEKSFFEALMFYLKIVLQMRYTTGGTRDDSDYILSPIAVDKKFFDSRIATPTEPNNADANGAYHIALKGLQLISTIENGKVNPPTTEKWFKYAQHREYQR